LVVISLLTPELQSELIVTYLELAALVRHRREFLHQVLGESLPVRSLELLEPLLTGLDLRALHQQQIYLSFQSFDRVLKGEGLEKYLRLGQGGKIELAKNLALFEDFTHSQRLVVLFPDERLEATRMTVR